MLGHKDDFTGPVDKVMDFFFWIPNLLVVQFLWWARQKQASTSAKWLAVLVMIIAIAFLCLGSFFSIATDWWPAIAGQFGAKDPTSEMIMLPATRNVPGLHGMDGSESVVEF